MWNRRLLEIPRHYPAICYQSWFPAVLYVNGEFVKILYRRTLSKCVVKCLRSREKREIASLIFAFARGFTWFARGSLFYCVLLNAIVDKNSQFAIIRLSHLKSVLR